MDINRNNYETFFLLYLDRELDPTEMLEVENFVGSNADLQKEFSLLSQTILIPAQTEFIQKELLFRKEDNRRLIPIYWTRIAAAAAVLAFAGWLTTAQWTGKHKDSVAGSDIKKNIVPAKKNSTDQKIKETNNHAEALPPAAVNEIKGPVQQNTITKNQSVRNSGKEKSSLKQNSNLSGKNNPGPSLLTVNNQPSPSVDPGRQTPSSVEDPDKTNLTMQKSSVQELQPVNSQNSTGPKQISTLPGSHSTGLLIAAGSAENVKHENAMFAENEDQTDNAISVVALNEKNKGITKLFKKLTSRTPADENERKVRVSVFQFSY